MNLDQPWKVVSLGATTMFLVGGIAFLQGQNRPSRPTDRTHYQIVSCRDTESLMNVLATHRGTNYDDSNKEEMKSDCETLLNAAGTTPVLYMGRDHDGRHLVLVKAPF